MHFDLNGPIAKWVHREFPKPLRNIVFAGGIGAISALVAWMVLITNGNAFAVIGVLSVMVVMVVTLYRVDWGFYLFVLLVFVFDQFPIGGNLIPFTYTLGYLIQLSSIEYLPPFPDGKISPMELHLFFILIVWLLAIAGRSKSPGVKIHIKVPLMLFIAAGVASFFYGIARGGDISFSFWEIRALAYLVLLFIFVPKIIETKEQLQTLLWVMIIGIGFKAFQGALLFASMGFTMGTWPHIYETLTNHEDPLFFITLFLFLLGLVIFGDRGRQQKVLLWLLVPLTLGFIAAQRRATYASFCVTLLAFVVLLSKKDRMVIMKPLLVLVVVFVLYVAAFWNSSYGRFSMVALSVKATITGEGGVRGGDKDYTSTLYRKMENYNLAYSYQVFPIVGSGFGLPFLTPRWIINFNKLASIIPHNQILWIFVKTGALGGFLFWLFFNSFAFNGARVFAKLSDPYLKAVCAVCVVAIVNQFVVSFVDMQLTWYRNMIHLGILMGLIPVCQNLDAKIKSRESALHQTGD
jgi:hypothetical protein